MTRKKSDAYLRNYFGKTNHTKRKYVFGDIVQQPANYNRLHQCCRGHKKAIGHKQPKIALCITSNASFEKNFFMDYNLKMRKYENVDMNNKFRSNRNEIITKTIIRGFDTRFRPPSPLPASRFFFTSFVAQRGILHMIFHIHHRDLDWKFFESPYKLCN